MEETELKPKFNVHEFMRDKDIPSDELRLVVLENLEDILSSFPEIDLSNVEEISRLEDGTYQCKMPPDIPFLKNEKNYTSGDIEMGVFKIKGKWLFTVSHSLVTGLPDYLESIENDGLFDFDGHSHPGGEEEGSEVPGRGDVSKLKNTIDGYCHIMSRKGMKSFCLPHYLPGGFVSLDDAGKAMEYWKQNELHIDDSDGKNLSIGNYKKSFMKSFSG